MARRPREKNLGSARAYHRPDAYEAYNHAIENAESLVAWLTRGRCDQAATRLEVMRMDQGRFLAENKGAGGGAVSIRMQNDLRSRVSNAAHKFRKMCVKH